MLDRLPARPMPVTRLVCLARAGGTFLLADRTGKVVLCMPMDVPEVPMLDAWIARAVGR